VTGDLSFLCTQEWLVCQRVSKLWKTIASAELRKLTEIDLTSLAKTSSWLDPASFLRAFNPSVVTNIVINLNVVRLTYVPKDIGVPTQVFHPRVLVFYGQRW
jgi:hypothetical protein